MSGRLTLRAVLVAAALQAGPAGACFLETVPDAFTVAHPGSLSVAVATRAAVENGVLDAAPAGEKGRILGLYRVRLLAVNHTRQLAGFRMHGPPVSVLLVQSGAWIRVNDPVNGAVYHSRPPAPDEAAILLPDRAYEHLLRGDRSLGELERHGLVRIYGSDPAAAREILIQAVERFDG